MRIVQFNYDNYMTKPCHIMPLLLQDPPIHSNILKINLLKSYVYLNKLAKTPIIGTCFFIIKNSFYRHNNVNVLWHRATFMQKPLLCSD